jgi:hypothetical protein
MCAGRFSCINADASREEGARGRGTLARWQVGLRCVRSLESRRLRLRQFSMSPNPPRLMTRSCIEKNKKKKNRVDALSTMFFICKFAEEDMRAGGR